MPPRSRGIVTLAVWGDEGLFSCFLWLPGLFECVQTRFEDSPGRKKPRKNQKMIVKIGENQKWCLGVAAPSHTLCAEDVRRKAEHNCGDVNGRCGAVPLIVGGGMEFVKERTHSFENLRIKCIAVRVQQA